MKLLEFVEKYNNMANNTLREQLLSKIKITPYVSFIKKEVYAQLIVDKTTFEQEAYDDNGVTKYRKTDKIRVNSVAQYVQFCRAVIELYTDLEIDEDDKGFINETTTQAFISKQIGRISDLANATLTPLVDVVNKKLDSLSNDELRKILDDYKLKTTENFKEV